MVFNYIVSYYIKNKIYGIFEVDIPLYNAIN